MIEVMVPEHESLSIEHLVLDYNGTLACDGRLLPGVRERARAPGQTASLSMWSQRILSGRPGPNWRASHAC